MNPVIDIGAEEDRRPAQVVQDRSGYWFPMLLFGVLILAAPMVYRPSPLPAGIDYSSLAFAPLQQFGTCAALGDPMSVALYWFCVVMFGPLVILLWYHLRARRAGVVPQTGWHLLYALTSLALYVVLYPLIEFVTLSLPRGTAANLSPGTQHLAAWLSACGFEIGLLIAAVAIVPRRFGRRMSSRRWATGGFGLLLAIGSAAAIQFVAYLEPRNSYGALLIIGIGLLALSLVEPGRTCAVIAVVFTTVALVTNLFGMRTPMGMGGRPSPVDTAMSSLLLPGLVLIVGGLIGVIGIVVARRRVR
ncbi:MAG TPA: hypothetical protein VH352_04965 [Pseudonocardiaceae bacterium]|jgi:hypothetical protein|nr:hypothetical protein [Pseudonocardiaceae bacterium]